MTQLPYVRFVRSLSELSEYELTSWYDYIVPFRGGFKLFASVLDFAAFRLRYPHLNNISLIN